MMAGTTAKPIPAGTVYGRLTALSTVRAGRTLFQCSCGTVKEIANTSVRRGASTSCGCRRVEEVRARATTHGASKGNPLYRVWASMWERCTREDNKHWARYGGRGIAVDPAWKDFARFLEDMGPRPEGRYSVDRIDNDKGYSKGNCHWATDIEQARNRCSTQRYEHNGVSLTIVELSELSGVPASTIRTRMQKQGMSISEALSAPSRYFGGFENRSKRPAYQDLEARRMKYQRLKLQKAATNAG